MKETYAHVITYVNNAASVVKNWLPRTEMPALNIYILWSAAPNTLGTGMTMARAKDAMSSQLLVHHDLRSDN